MDIIRILVGSPVRQKHQILLQFLNGLEEVDKTGFSVSYYFIDDNVDEKSTELLNTFAKSHNVMLMKGAELTSLDSYSNYISDEVTHIWDASTIRKVAYFKDYIIKYALENNFDYLFFVDSDIVIDRRTLKHLVSRKVEIVSNIFWTQWQPNWQLEPQCFWMPALNRQSRTPFGPPISGEEARQIQKDFFAKMRIPGIFKVDGLGACTLIAKSALKKGVKFKEIPNLSLLGEDRHFCIRAGALGIDLYYDTVYPVYHIYREEYLDRVDEFKREGFKYDMCQTFTSDGTNKASRSAELSRICKKAASYIARKTVLKIRSRLKRPFIYSSDRHNNTIALLMVVCEDNLKYFRNALCSVHRIVDYFIIIDTTTTGKVSKICVDIIKEHPYRVIPVENRNIKEYQLYQQFWTSVDKYNPGWILCQDADEVFPEESTENIRYLIENTSIDAYMFRRLDMWNMTEYRDDNLWNSQRQHVPYLMRYQKGYKYTWKNNAGFEKFPDEIQKLSYANINIRIRNYRWANVDARKKDYEIYSRVNAESQHSMGEKCKFLLDKDPLLKKYNDLPNEI